MAKIKQRLLSLSILLIGLGLCLPVYKKIYQAFLPTDNHVQPGFELPPEVIVELEPEPEPEPELKTSAYGSYENQLELKAEQPNQELADNAEVIFVSGYEPTQDLDADKRIKVKIDRPGKNVVLVLSNYESVIWEVEASPSTNIAGILQGSYNPSAVVTTVATEGFLVDLPYAYELENLNFVEAMEKLNKWLEIEKVDAFVGYYKLPASITVSELDAPNPALTLAGYPTQKPVNNFEFTLYDRNYNPKQWTLAGAVSTSDRDLNIQAKTVVSPDGTEIYEVSDEGIKITNRETGEQEEFKPPSKFPEFSWATDLAYDSKRDLLAVISLGGEGYLYRFDLKERRWLDVRSANNLDITSLTYDSVTDKYIAWDGGHTDGGSLLAISGTGELLSSEYIADKMPGYLRLYDRGNGSAPHIQVKANGSDLALIAYRDDYDGSIAASPQAIWHYNLNSKTMQLTYQGDR